MTTISICWTIPTHRYTKKLKNIYETQGFKQIVKEPTRVTERSATLFDPIFTNVNNLVNTNGKISDHQLINVCLEEMVVSNETKQIKKVDKSKLNTLCLNM